MGIKIGWWAISSIRYGQLQNDYSAMQWPCPNGFHIPDKDEWEALVDIWATIWAYVRWNSWTYATAEYPFRQYFKIPRIAYFELSWALNVPGRFAFVCYLSCKDKYAVHVIASSGRIPSPVYNGTDTNWYPIRPFKDVPEVPDSSWTMLYDWSSVATWAGIFYNSSLGLISASKDWVTWKTIADKDIWATNPYNQTDWSVQIDAVWHMFQWWNNHWFPYPDSVTTSSTQVDASSYWPWNYYNDSTWITTWPRDSSDNLNLRGGTTWVKQTPSEVKKIMMRPNNVETQVWPSKWTPGSHTLIYLPLNNTYQTANLWTLNRVFTVDTTWWNTYSRWTNYRQSNWPWVCISSEDVTGQQTYTNFTINFWIYYQSYTWGTWDHYKTCFVSVNDFWDSDAYNVDIKPNSSLANSWSNNLIYTWDPNDIKDGWHNICCVDWVTYIDNVLQTYQEWTITSKSIIPRNIFLATSHRYWLSTSYWITWKRSEVIIEDRAWTEGERTAYFNQTKWNYWIS